jgi:hypothetical protein
VEFFRPLLPWFEGEAEDYAVGYNHNVKEIVRRVAVDDKYTLELRKTAGELDVILHYAGGGWLAFLEGYRGVEEFAVAGIMTPEICNYVLDRIRRVTEIKLPRGSSNTSRRNSHIRSAVHLVGEEFGLNQAKSIGIVSRALNKLDIDMDEDTIRRDILPEARAKRRPKRQPKRRPKVGRI